MLGLNVVEVVAQWCMCQPGVAGPWFGLSLGVAKTVQGYGPGDAVPLYGYENQRGVD